MGREVEFETPRENGFDSVLVTLWVTLSDSLAFLSSPTINRQTQTVSYNEAHLFSSLLQYSSRLAEQHAYMHQKKIYGTANFIGSRRERVTHPFSPVSRERNAFPWNIGSSILCRSFLCMHPCIVDVWSYVKRQQKGRRVGWRKLEKDGQS